MKLKELLTKRKKLPSSLKAQVSFLELEATNTCYSWAGGKILAKYMYLLCLLSKIYRTVYILFLFLLLCIYIFWKMYILEDVCTCTNAHVHPVLFNGLYHWEDRMLATGILRLQQVHTQTSGFLASWIQLFIHGMSGVCVEYTIIN